MKKEYSIKEINLMKMKKFIEKNKITNKPKKDNGKTNN